MARIPIWTARPGVAFVKGCTRGPCSSQDGRDAKALRRPQRPEDERHHFNAEASERDLRETVSPGVGGHGPRGRRYSAMGAYNRTNGELLAAPATRRYRRSCATSGDSTAMSSDCAPSGIFANHQVVVDAGRGRGDSCTNGCDLNCGEVYKSLLIARPRPDRRGDDRQEGGDAPVHGAVPVACLTRQKAFYAAIPIEVNDSAEHRASALQMACGEPDRVAQERGLRPCPRRSRRSP